MKRAWDLKVAVIVVLVLAIAWLGRADAGRYIARSRSVPAASCPSYDPPVWLPAVSTWGCGDPLTLTGG